MSKLVTIVVRMLTVGATSKMGESESMAALMRARAEAGEILRRPISTQATSMALGMLDPRLSAP